MIVNWPAKPIITPLGILSTPEKSFKDNVVPMPNMMICIRGIMSPESLKSPTWIKYCGKYIAAVTAAKIMIVKTYPFNIS